MHGCFVKRGTTSPNRGKAAASVDLFNRTKRVEKPNEYSPSGGVVSHDDRASPPGSDRIVTGQRIGINGTKRSPSIGQPQLAGCIHMVDVDIVETLGRLNESPRVRIRWQGGTSARKEDGRGAHKQRQHNAGTGHAGKNQKQSRVHPPCKLLIHSGPNHQKSKPADRYHGNCHRPSIRAATDGTNSSCQHPRRGNKDKGNRDLPCQQFRQRCTAPPWPAPVLSHCVLIANQRMNSRCALQCGQNNQSPDSSCSNSQPKNHT